MNRFIVKIGLLAMLTCMGCGEEETVDQPTDTAGKGDDWLGSAGDWLYDDQLFDNPTQCSYQSFDKETCDFVCSVDGKRCVGSTSKGWCCPKTSSSTIYPIDSKCAGGITAAQCNQICFNQCVKLTGCWDKEGRGLYLCPNTDSDVEVLPSTGTESCQNLMPSEQTCGFKCTTECTPYTAKSGSIWWFCQDGRPICSLL